MRWVLLVGLIAACESPRTEIVIGVATDIKAPDIIDGAELVVTRAADGFPEQQVSWAISGVPNEPFNLPGSYGLYSDGEEVKLTLELNGLRGNTPVVTRRAVLNLVKGKTLFFRMGLTAGCVDKNDCTATQSCVEGACVDREVDGQQLPEFDPGLVTELTCTPGAQYIDTSTGSPMPLSDDAAACPPELCIDGTCLKPPPPQTEPRTVTGSKITTFIQPNAFTNVPADLSQDPPSALVPDGAGAYTTIAGRGSSDGSFAIDGVPPGPYLLKDGTDYHATSSKTFDLGSVAQGRPTAVPATATTSLALTVSNMTAFAASDGLEAMSANTDTWWFELESSVPIAPNATALSGYTITTDLSLGNHLIMGDDFTLLHLGSKQAATGQLYTATTQALRPPAFTQTDGGTTPITGAFADLPQSSTFQTRFRPSAWDDATGFDGTKLAALGPSAAETSAGLVYFVHGHIGGTVYGRTGNTADFVAGRIPHGPDVDLDGVTFGYPFPLTEVWGQLFSVEARGRVLYQLPGTSQPARLQVGISIDRAVTSAADPVVPTLGPVRAPTIDGLDLFQPQTSLSETPTIAWQAPVLGTPTQYVVIVHELRASNGATTATLVARLFTSSTSILVPPGIFVADRTYAIQIRATTTPNPSAPHRFRLPGADATVASAILGMQTPQGTMPECAPCVADGDCLRGRCSGNVCIAGAQVVTSSLGNDLPAYVRDDGAILIAHYGAGTRHDAYDPAQIQETTTTGGATPPMGWVPDACRESGHISFAEWNPAGRSVIIECGTAPDAIMGSFESPSLFSSFANGAYGTVGASGTPGWAAIGAVGSGFGRSSHAMCGVVGGDTSTGGIAYCDGPGGAFSFANHLASYMVGANATTPFVGCAGTGCNGTGCNLQIWVWLK